MNPSKPQGKVGKSKPDAAYRRVMRTVRERIQSVQWRPGELIPGEAELAEQHGCSRLTAHRALRELAAEGLVERRRKAGTRVAAQPGAALRFEIPRIDLEITDRGAVYGYRLLHRATIRSGAALAERFAIPPGAPLLHLVCLHMADSNPFQLEERWINPAAVPQISGIEFSAQGPNAWLLDNVPWTDAEHVLRAAAPGPLQISHLGLSDTAPVLVIERRTWRAQQIVTFVRLSHPGRDYFLCAPPRSTSGPELSPKIADLTP